MKELSQLTSLYGHAWRQLKKGFEERIVEEVEEKEDKKKMTKVMTMKGSIQYGSFIKLPRDCQELAVCSLYYVSNLSSDFLQTLAGYCLCNNMEPVMLLRIIDVLHSAYKAGHLHISDHIGFLVTLVAHKVFSGATEDYLDDVGFAEDNQEVEAEQQFDGTAEEPLY